MTETQTTLHHFTRAHPEGLNDLRRWIRKTPSPFRRQAILEKSSHGAGLGSPTKAGRPGQEVTVVLFSKQRVPPIASAQCLDPRTLALVLPLPYCCRAVHCLVSTSTQNVIEDNTLGSTPAPATALTALAVNQLSVSSFMAPFMRVWETSILASELALQRTKLHLLGSHTCRDQCRKAHQFPAHSRHTLVTECLEPDNCANKLLPPAVQCWCAVVWW